MKVLGSIVQMILGLGLVIYSGWILTFLWAWFVMPITGASPLTIAPACGLSLVISFVRFNPVIHIKNLNHMGEAPEWEQWQILLLGFTVGTLLFFYAWVIKLFI